MKAFSRPGLMLVASAAILATVSAVRFFSAPVDVAPFVAPAPAVRADTNASDTQVLQGQLGASDTQSAINTLQSRIRQSPDTAKLYAQLGWAYVQRLRETADASIYSQAEQSFNEALKRDGKDVDALLGQGSLALSRHEFAQAIIWGEKAKVLNPFRAQVYGVIGDAQIEMGQYTDAINTIQKMVNTRPDLNSYSRVSYLRELNGDIDGAIDAMRKAVEAGNPRHESTLWSQYQLGNLYFNKGDLAQAEEIYKGALQVKSDYIFARVGLARINAAHGVIDQKPELVKQATTEFEKINELLPLPEFVIALGDLYEVDQAAQKAQAQFDLVRAIQKLNASATMNVDMEMALFEADRLPLPDKSGADHEALGVVEKARAAYAHRPSIYAADTLAWALYKQSNFAEAQTYSKQALKLNTHDAVLHFHAGMIAYAAGDTAAAKQHLQTALSINPYFSIRYVPQTKQILATLK